MKSTPVLDVHHAATAAADALAEAWGGAGRATLMAWGDEPIIECIYCQGLSEELCASLTGDAGARIVEELRRRSEAVILETDGIGADDAKLQRALAEGGVSRLLLVPVPAGFGATGVVVVELEAAPGNAQGGGDSLALAQVERVSRLFRGLSLAASSAALSVVLAEEQGRRHPGMDGVVVIDRWDRILFSFGVVDEVPGWRGQSPFGRIVTTLDGGDLLAEIALSDPGNLVWEEHLLPPTAKGIPVAAAAVSFARRGDENHGRVVFFRDLRSNARRHAGERLLDLALQVAADLEHAEDPAELTRAGPEGPLGRRLDAMRHALGRQIGDAKERIGEAVRRTAKGMEHRTDLNEMLGRTLRSREREFLAEGVRVLRFLRPELTTVPGDPVALQHIVSGLMEHARDSLRPGGGTLTVRTWEENGEVFLAVSDDGRGVEQPASDGFQALYLELDPSSRSRHFLDDARELIEPWDGRLMVESRPGLWNRLTLMLPGARMAAAPETGDKPPESLPKAVKVEKGDEGLEVLVVDDNPSLRSVIRRYLERRGHKVTEAEDGGEALELVTERSFDRVVVDVKMPGTDGPTFFRSLDDVNPDLRARTIFMTGGLTEHTVEDFIESTGRPAIQKPFDLADMARTVES